MSAWLPWVVNVVRQVADPLETVWLPPAQEMLLPPSLNVTVPPLTVELPVTVAVSVTALFVPEVNDGLKLALSEVEVEVAAALSVKVKLQPLIDISSSLAYSPPRSTRYKLQVPFGLRPPLANAPVSVAEPNGAAAVSELSVPGPGDG